MREQIAAIEKSRIERIERAPNTGSHMMVRLLAGVIGVGIRRRICWCARCCHADYGIDERWRAMQGSRAHRMRAARSVARKALAKLAMPEYVVA